jgi:hypothetical protein
VKEELESLVEENAQLRQALNIALGIARSHQDYLNALEAIKELGIEIE